MGHKQQSKQQSQTQTQEKAERKEAHQQWKFHANTSKNLLRKWEKGKGRQGCALSKAKLQKPDIPKDTMPLLDEAIFLPNLIFSARLWEELEDLVWEGTRADWLWAATGGNEKIQSNSSSARRFCSWLCKHSYAYVKAGMKETDIWSI